MRCLSLILALLLATSLVALPVVSALAASHAVTAQASMGDDDCPCCKKAQPDGCLAKCGQLLVILVDGVRLARLPAARFAVGDAAVVALLPRPPEPPPPRA
jgi:hypothetical protein